MGIVRQTTSLELLHYYESLVREKRKGYSNTNRFSEAFQNKKRIFKKLIDSLEDQGIPPKEFVLAQFKGKGYRPYPTQLLSDKAFQRWRAWKFAYDIVSLHRIQEEYLRRLKVMGYSIEEALALDIFYYYFRMLKLKDVPKVWAMYAFREVEMIPGLKEFLEKR